MRRTVVALGLSLLFSGSAGSGIGAPASQLSVAAPEPLTFYRTRPGDTLGGLAGRCMTGWRDAAIVQRLSGSAAQRHL